MQFFIHCLINNYYISIKYNMATSEKSGKPKKVGRPKSSTKGTKLKPKTGTKSTGSKKGGNFLGSIGELVAPTGWGSFATTAALVGIDQADSAFRMRKSTKSSVKKMSGGGAEGNKNPLDILIEKYKIIKNTKNRKIPVNFYNNAMSYLYLLRKKNMSKFESELKRFEDEQINNSKFYKIPLYTPEIYNNNRYLMSVVL